MKSILYILFFLLGMQAISNGQRITNKGTDFWAGFGHTGPMEYLAWLPGEEPNCFFVISTGQEAAHVDITVQGTSYIQSFDVPANTVYTSDDMPKGLKGKPASLVNTMLYSKPGPKGEPGANSEGILPKKGIKIHSSVPVVVYEFVIFEASSAATMLIPVNSWGNSYKVLSPNQYVRNIETAPWYAWLFVIANYDNTRIKVVPTHPTRNGLPANTPIYVTLNKGEVYQIQAAAEDASVSNDFCGTTVTSEANSDGKCLPIAAFVGSSGNYIACNGSIGGVPPDMMIQQVFPVESWGRRYLATPSTYADLDSRLDNDLSFQPNIFRVMVKNPSIVVKRNGVPLTGLTPQNYYEYVSNAPDYIEADGPVQVAQLFPSQGACGYQGLGDPDMVFLSPIEQGIKKVGFLRSERMTIDRNLMTLNIPTAGLSSLIIDGKKDNWHLAIPNPNLPGYSVVVRKWNTKSSTDARAPAQCTVESDSAFTAIAYGLGGATSYAYSVGTYIDNLSGVPYIKNQYNNKDTANAHTCAKTPLELSVLIRYQPSKILWQLSELKDVLTPAADVLMNAPVSLGVEMVWGVPYYRYRLPDSYVFNKPGTYTVPVFATAPGVESCDNTEQIIYEVLVKDTLQTGFDILFDEKCSNTKLVKFVANDKFTDGSTIKDWQWSFLNGAVVSAATGKETSLTFNAGTNSARLIAVDGSGCIADTTKTIVFGPKPALPDFKIEGSITCENKAISVSEITPATVQSWYWDFGDGQVIDTNLNGQTVKHVYAKDGTYTIKHVVRSGTSCSSDTATKTIVVYASPKVNIKYPTGCLPDNGIVTFENTTTVSSNETITAHNWDFGDLNATAANPNASTAVSPSHTYMPGNYAIKYSATSSNGCVIDTILKASFTPHPVFSFTPELPGACENITTPVSVAKASVTNGLAGTGIYKGPGVTTAGDFTPSIPKAGSYTVWYVFTTNGGCMDSVSSIIKVHAQPQSKFTANADVCIDKTTSFTDQSTIDNIKDPGTTIKSWKWNFDDGTVPVTNANGNPFSKQFNTVKTYNVSLQTISDFGCESMAFFQPVVVHPLPIASLVLPTAICFKDAGVFTNKSTTADNAALTYNWNLGDGTMSTDANPAHVYDTKKDYTLKLTATSEYGCADDTTITLPLTVFKDKPVADFDVKADKPCQDEDYYFTDKSSPSANVVSWNWTFGDGTSSTEKDPVKKYSSFGDKKVSLTVTDIYGCASNSGEMATSKTVLVNIKPVISAGPDMAVDEGTSVRLQGKADNADKLVFAWAPASLLSGANTLTPMYNAIHDQLFELTATDKDGVCSASDQVFIKMLRPVKVPNAFSPNGDGINDKWMIANLADYSYCKVSVYNRYGQVVYASSGYTNPWDGTMNGAPLAVGTYYYIINLNNGEPNITGSVTILR